MRGGGDTPKDKNWLIWAAKLAQLLIWWQRHFELQFEMKKYKTNKQAETLHITIKSFLNLSCLH